VAVAQSVTVGYPGLPYKAPDSKDNNNGIQISDGVLMHVGTGAEVGYDSNVFYQDKDTTGSGIVRVNGFAEITNATRTGAVPSGLSFDVRAGLQYRRYTSTDSKLNGYHDAFMPSAGVILGTSVSPTVSFGFADAFLRSEDAPYSPGQLPILRDNNQAAAEMRWAPGGGRINTVVRYTNIVDIFQNNTYSYADSLTQELMFDGSWKWLPKTALFLQIRQGYVSYLNTGATNVNSQAPPKYSSFPLHATAGLRGLITEKTSAMVVVGYANSIYSCSSGAVACVTTGGFLGSTYANAEITYRPTVLARILAGWRQDFQNSVISTFYYSQQVYASYVQQLGSRVALDLSGTYYHKNYQGFVAATTGGVLTPQPRIDNSYMVGLSAQYFVRTWAYAGVGYQLMANVSDYQIPVTPANSVNYVKNQVFAHLGLTY
jgi:hypothetical protein